MQRSFMKHQKPMIDTNGQEKVKSSQQGKNTLHLMIYKKLAILIQTFGKGNMTLQIKLFTLHLKVHLAGFAIWGLIP